MIKTAATAIKTLYDSAGGAALRALNTGGLFFQDASQTVTEPYTVFSWAGSVTDDTMGGQTDRIERGDITFNTFSKADDGGLEALNISAALQDLYDWATLTMGGSFSSIAFERNSTGPVFFIDEVWQVTNLYTFWIDW